MVSNSLLLDALGRLNQIGEAVNQLGSDEVASVGGTLSLIVESAIEVVSGSSAVIYTYDEAQGNFDPNSRVSAEQDPRPQLDDFPRTNGLGARAVAERRRVLSYEEPDLQIHPAKQALGARALACFPLVVAGEVLGTLYVYLLERSTFTRLELLMLENFVNLTAMTLSYARQLNFSQQEQARKEKELRRLRRAGILISSRTSLKGTLEVILSMALEVMDAQYGIFRLVDAAGQNLITHAIAGDQLGRPAVEALPLDEKSVMGMVASKREPLMISDLREPPWCEIYYPLDRELEMRSELAVPLIGASGRLEGVLNLESPQVNAFDKQDRYILQILATQAVIAIQEVRLLDALQEITALLLTEPLQQFHQGLVEKACDLLNVPASLLWLIEYGELRLQAASDVSLVGKRLPLEKSLAYQALQSGQPLSCFEDCADWGISYPDLAFLDGLGSGLIVPLFSSEDGKDLGVFCIFSSQADLRDFDRSEWFKKVVSILGHYAVLAVQNAAHQEALRTVQEQRAVAETFAAVGDIATNLLHSLNNKVGTIPVRIEGIQDKCQPALDADPYLEKNLLEIERSASEAMQIVRESLFHLHPIQLSPVQVSECVREAAASLSFPEGVQLQIEGLEDLPVVQAGRKRLSMVFLNLFDNAIASHGIDGLIRVSGERRANWVEISVTDSGPGIAPELHERIFEFNYSTHLAERPGKLGFGLWWVKTLLARFGGKISVESDGHTGTTFRLSLPVEEQVG